MPDKKEFALGDYIEVKDRIAIFYELYAQGRLVTDEVTILTAPDGKQRVMAKALAYRDPSDSLPGVGYSWLELPGKTPYTNGSEVENAETSAWGRAIASLGILIDRGIASRHEVESKSGSVETKRTGEQTEVLIGELTRTGTIERGDGIGSDLQAHVTPDGHLIGFRLKTARGNIAQVWAEGDISETLFAAASMDVDKLLKEKATVHGLVYDVRQEGRTTFQRMRLKRIEVLGVVIPPNPISPIRPVMSDPETVAPPADEAARLEALADELPWPAGMEAKP